MPESKPLQKVLIANRGEIAVRVIRACKDAGIGSVAVYADPDRDALFVRLADEAYAWAGRPRPSPTSTSRRSSTVAQQSGADSVHPGYGFLAENAGFAQAVLDAGLVWIGPPPAAIESLGDKVKARHIAEKVGAPLVAGTKDPVEDADEVVAFAKEHGLPIAIKAAFGGGGRGLKVARDDRGGRRHVRVRGPRGRRRVRPRRVLRRALPRPAAARRDPVPGRPARQRRRRLDPRLLAAAPPPEARRGGARAVPHRRAGRPALRRRPRRSCARPGTSAPAPASSWSARTAPSRSSRSTPGCRSSTRSPRRSPASTWSARCSASPPARSSATTTREVRGHSIEFRINAEDAGRNFMPAPGTLTAWHAAVGPRRAPRRRLRRTARPSPARSTR